MASRVSSRSAWLVAFTYLTAVQPALAEEPDQRNIPPFVMVVADTSGSMEYLPGCACTTEGCVECLPNCAADNSPAGLKAKKNRWAVLLEALTGQFKNFQCTALDRTSTNLMDYDLGYPKPYHRPWSCPVEKRLCDYPGSALNPTGGADFQYPNGLLDAYRGSIRFGVATFDGKRTYGNNSDLVKEDSFVAATSEGPFGSYSYGGAKPLRYPSCTDNYLIDSGIRRPGANEGGLISLDTCAPALQPCNGDLQNAEIQDMLLHTRTFGGTPIASALDDLYFHYRHDLADSMKACRDRYTILITDGYPDDDFRDYPTPGCDCANRGGCGTDNPLLMSCPYPLATTAAKSLVEGAPKTTDGPQIKRLFVVGMSVNDALSKQKLNLLASYGNNPDRDGNGSYAFFADEASSLTSTLDTLLSAIARPISRSVPAFATGLSGIQYQISAGFRVSQLAPPTNFTAPWLGILERRRFACTEGGILSNPELTADDKFNETLNSRNGLTRVLKTALPTSTTVDLDGKLTREVGYCGATTACDMTLLKDVPKERLGANVTLEQQKVILDWMYGAAGSVRATEKLGDIYHSSPTVVGPPVEDPGDQSYSLFRESTKVAERPIVVYVNSNDGILHAFSLEKYPVVGTPTSPPVPTDPSYALLKLEAGEELWGFVPPTLLTDLGNQMSVHHLYLDSTPVVKDVYFSKGSKPSAADYHTLLVTGMRAGGNAYVALDVTDPTKPQFLWQFTDPAMGLTYGQPEIVQAVYSWPPGTPAAPHAMVILSGGKGELATAAENPACANASGVLTMKSARPTTSSSRPYTTVSDPDPTNTSAPALDHRLSVQCWKQAGRALYFVDAQTGVLIKKIYDNGTIFPSPLVGTPTAYLDTVGSIATEGFVLDADGVLWRIDLTATDPKKDSALEGWTVRPFHDLFWDRGAAEGETTYERPILSLDEYHRVVVLVGTGDTDHFDKIKAQNRVVSLTELSDTTPILPSHYRAALNWEHIVVPNDKNSMAVSELVTGTMALFQGQLFVPSFISAPVTSDACEMGRGRLWSFDYHGRDTTRANPLVSGAPTTTYGPKRIKVTYGGTTVDNTDTGLFNVSVDVAEKNLLVLGLGTTQRPACGLADSALTANYFTPTLPGIHKPAQPPALWIVGQASGDKASRKRAGSQLSSLEVEVGRNQAFSQLASWAGSVE